MTKGFKDKDGKFRPTGKKNGIKKYVFIGDAGNELSWLKKYGKVTDDGNTTTLETKEPIDKMTKVLTNEGLQSRGTAYFDGKTGYHFTWKKLGASTITPNRASVTRFEVDNDKYNKRRNYEILAPLWIEWLKTRKGAFRNYGNWEDFILDDNSEKTSGVKFTDTVNNPFSDDIFDWFESKKKRQNVID